MNMPDFTAEVSLYKTSKSYGMAANIEGMQVSRTVYPQRVTGPFGPIGLPGQDCEGACEHICRTFGGGDWCVKECRASCGGTPSGLALR